MKLAQMAQLLEAEVICNDGDMERDIPIAAASDMMSDVLVSTDQNRVLITGLCTVHTVLTAQMLDLKAVIFARGKMPTPEMIEIASQNGITLMRTERTMYVVCGELYSNGLKGLRRIHD
ncbi:MAG: hypothetical protein LBN26_03045 [Christensenellaceae bacterium]|jgi:serine kinase of HPr protein (carbohydrate metabolism regulator)|nr:hypothetical protein [Christensenellaceae bacterium]